MAQDPKFRDPKVTDGGAGGGGLGKWIGIAVAALLALLLLAWLLGLFADEPETAGDVDAVIVETD